MWPPRSWAGACAGQGMQGPEPGVLGAGRGHTFASHAQVPGPDSAAELAHPRVLIHMRDPGGSSGVRARDCCYELPRWLLSTAHTFLLASTGKWGLQGPRQCPGMEHGQRQPLGLAQAVSLLPGQLLLLSKASAAPIAQSPSSAAPAHAPTPSLALAVMTGQGGTGQVSAWLGWMKGSRERPAVAPLGGASATRPPPTPAPRCCYKAAGAQPPPVPDSQVARALRANGEVQPAREKPCQTRTSLPPCRPHSYCLWP